MRCLCVIPARYASQRCPGKMLADLGGRPLIWRTAEQARHIPGVERFCVATDDQRIAEALSESGFELRMTSADHPSGTDRIVEVLEAEPDIDLILNVQGDEPFLDPELAGAVLASLQDGQADMATACTPIRSVEELQDPSVVKVVMNDAGEALYFSRAVIPHARDLRPEEALASGLYQRHLGLYAYTRAQLLRWKELQPHPLEQLEKLEQLRALADGSRIRVLPANAPEPGIDTPEDLERARVLWAERKRSDVG